MKHKLTKSLIITVLSGSISCSFAESFDDWGISMLDHKKSGASPIMKVSSDGNKYTKALSTPINFKMKSKGRCEKLHYVGKTSVVLQKKAPGFWDDVLLKEIKIFDKKYINRKTWSNDWVPRSMTITPKSFLKNKAVKACNKALDKKILGGKSREAVLKEGLFTKINVVKSKAIMRCHGISPWAGHPKSVTANHEINVSCEKFVPKIKPLKAEIIEPFKLKSVSLSMPKNNYQGFCPAKLSANATVKTNSVAANFSYRFFIDGKPTGSWKIAKGKKGNDKVNIPYIIQIDKPKKVGNSNAFSNGGIQNNTNNVIQVAPLLEKKPTHKLSIKVRTTKQNISTEKEYSVTCKDRPKRATLSKSKPDLTSRKGITIGPKSVSWGQTINLKKSDSLSKNARGCKFRFKYDVLNIGNIKSGPATHKLKDGNAVIHSVKNFNVDKAQSKNVSGHLILKPGKHLITAWLDNPNKVDEKKENNNKFNVTVNVDADCGNCSDNNSCPRPGPQ